MQFNRYDMAVIEQALREAINQGADYHKVSTYQSVLGKLQEISPDSPAAAAVWEDGFRRGEADGASQ